MVTTAMKEAMAKAAEEAFHEAPSSPVPLNTTGINPVEFKVLIMLEPTPEKTEGDVHLPDEYQERQQAAATSALLVAVGGNAFEDWNGMKPEPGDLVLLNKYSGQPPKAGDLRNLYRLCNDKDICAVLT